MKQRLTILSSLAVAAYFSSCALKAQMVGTETFLQGNYVEVGISECGVYGSTAAPPVGFHPNAALPGLGFVADPDRDGWASTSAGGPFDYCGDYFVPGSPVEGWALTFNGVDYINTDVSCTSFDVPGANAGYTTGPDEDTATWVGGVAGMTVIQKTLVPTDSVYFLTRMKLINTTGSTMLGVYYGRNVDPDNEQPWSGDFSTLNTIISQPSASTDNALVLSVGSTGYCYLGLGTQDPRASVNYGGFGTIPADDLYFGVGRTTMVGSSTVADIGNGLGFSLGDIAPGDSVEFSFVYVMDTNNLDDAMLRTAPTCAYDNHITAAACGSYNFGGSVLTSSGTYTDSLLSVCGEDSIVTLTLTIGNPSSASVSETACDSYLFGGTLLSASGTYNATFTNASGCDSTVTLTLTIENSSSLSISETACDSYLFNGSLLTSSGTYNATLTNAAGCDSTITLTLTIVTIDPSVSFATGTLTAAAAGLTYQWVDCDLGYAPIAGATSQSFTPLSDGHYAVILTSGSCMDTSACTEVLVTSMNTAETAGLNVYPNPAQNRVDITITPAHASMSVQIMNTTGQVMWEKTFSNTTTVSADLSSLAPGVYFVKAKSGDLERIVKVLKM